MKISKWASSFFYDYRVLYEIEKKVEKCPTYQRLINHFRNSFIYQLID